MIVSVLVLCFIIIAIYVGSHRLNGVQTIAVILFFLVGVVVVVFPTVAAGIAEHLGVGRGVDLVLYLSVVGGLFVAANFYFRIKSQEDMLGTMAREIALMAPREHTVHAAPPAGDRPAPEASS